MRKSWNHYIVYYLHLTHDPTCGYVGSTVGDFRNRFHKHFSDARAGRSGPVLNEWLLHYPKTDFDIDILEEKVSIEGFSKSEILERERYWRNKLLNDSRYLLANTQY